MAFTKKIRVQRISDGKVMQMTQAAITHRKKYGLFKDFDILPEDGTETEIQKKAGPSPRPSRKKVEPVIPTDKKMEAGKPAPTDDENVINGGDPGDAQNQKDPE